MTRGARTMRGIIQARRGRKLACAHRARGSLKLAFFPTTFKILCLTRANNSFPDFQGISERAPVDPAPRPVFPADTVAFVV